MALEVRRRRTGAGDRAVEIIDIVGRLDMPGSALLRSAVQDILKEGFPRIALNLANCVEIHREMIGTFHSLGRACHRAGGNLALFGQKGDVLEYIKRFGDTSLAPWYDREREAIVALGGEVEAEGTPKSGEEVKPLVVILGSDSMFRGVFRTFERIGGKPVVMYDNTDACAEFIFGKHIHSLLIDATMSAHDTARLIKRIRSDAELKNTGVFIVGPPSKIGAGRALMGEGADNFIPFVFSGEEISAKFDGKAFFTRLKDAYERYETKLRAKENR
ncbi:MAG: STAS domain-containing protein [bacterium]